MRNRFLTIIFIIMISIALAACSATEHQSSSQTNQTINQETKITLPDASLKSGDKGEDVKSVQNILSKIGYSLTVNGVFDTNTKWALKDFQAQQVKLAASGIYDKHTKEWLKKALNGDFKVKPGDGISQKNVKAAANGVITVSNPKDALVLVNKHHALPDGYAPEDLVVPNVRFPFTEDLPKKYMRKEAADALSKLFAAGDKAGVSLFAQSGYRSYERQVGLFAAYVEKDGEKAANKYSARPGQSEHQTGLTMDITSAAIDFQLTIPFEDTAEGKWVKENAHKYGFIIRYPKGKEAITGYQYEPWHLRYVGIDAATVMYTKHITFEEYLGVVESA